MGNRIRVCILTSLRQGSASVCLKELIKSDKIDVVGVILSRNIQKKSQKVLLRKFRKIIKIGIIGSINGIRMRKWFGEDVQSIMQIQDIGEVCSARGINFYEVEFINSKETKDILQSMKADVGLSLGNSYIAPSVFQIPEFGMLNLHGEILPDFQNAQSVIWQLYFGSSNTGYTIHEVNRKIDGGDILKREIVPIIFKSNLRSTVTSTCSLILIRASIGLRLVLENFDEYKRSAVTQSSGNSFTTPNIWQFMRIIRQFNRLKSSNIK